MVKTSNSYCRFGAWTEGCDFISIYEKTLKHIKLDQ